MKHILIAGIFGIIGLGAYAHGFDASSTYSATSADMALIQSIQPSIDRILVADAARGQQILAAIQGLSTRFGVDTREYYILGALYDYMSSHTTQKLMNVTTPTDTGSMQLDTYMLYSPKTLDAALEAGLQVVINFRASRCPTCKATSEDIIAHQSEIPAGVIILEADYDTTQDLQETYGVKHQTTFSFLNSDGTLQKNVWLNRGIEQLLEELK